MEHISDARVEGRNDITLVAGRIFKTWLREVGGPPSGRSEDFIVIDELGNCADTISLLIYMARFRV
jgi:hypothetical protein